MQSASATLQVPRHPPNPRRPSANSSVSLRHVPASSRANNGSVSTGGSSRRRDGASSCGAPSPSSRRPLVARGSSGESSNAEHWFDRSNNQPSDNRASFADHEPPFFLRNASSLETPPETQHRSAHHALASESFPLRTELLHLGTDGSGTDDFRGVIDDLTVQNKKLKRRLRRYEKLHDAHLNDDKLFEVRIHGLPPGKKRELEEMLRTFASGLGTNGDNAFPPDGYSSLLPMLNKETSRATSHLADSAYASMAMSMSGPGSSAVSGSGGKAKATPSGHASARQRNIHSYLHDIPSGLLAERAPANMTERAKKKLLVRKIEQLFVGKGAVGGHQHPLQQQEVSMSAAQADRSAMVAAGQSARAYGAREAPILGHETSDLETVDASADAPDQAPQQAKSGAHDEKLGSRDTEQRPTQPIDLDPDRAQVPLDNIRYMRAMGFSPPHPGDTAEEGHGWIYINFLFNMAQLHTLHVTTEFALEALTTLSDKLEVSQDGRKVRWRGGRSITRTTSSGDGTPNTGDSSEALDGQSPRKRSKRTHDDDGDRSSAQAAGRASSRTHDRARHMYTPMFHHRDSTDDSVDSSSDGEETDEPSPRHWDPRGNDSSRMTSSGVQPSTRHNVAGRKRKKPKRDDGPIIFYNNARFCTDLSGERRPGVNQKVPLYSTGAAYPVGAKADPDPDAEGRGPLADAAILPEPMDLGESPMHDSWEISFSPHSPRETPAERVNPFHLEVTGIGGVWPEDNFMLNVETRHAHVDEDDVSCSSTTAASNALPPRFAGILSSSNARGKSRVSVGHEVVDVEVQKLPPSPLPPALGFMESGDGTSEEDSDDDDDDASSPGPHVTHAPPPEVSTQPVDFAHRYSSSEHSDDDDADEEDEEDESDDDDDGEVDLLAAIRQAHPEFVRAQEREYDANMAERLAEEIPAGSSAVTAGGGGSGFASPASAATAAAKGRVGLRLG